MALEEFGKELLLSLQRAGDHFVAGGATMEDNKANVWLSMSYEFQDKARTPLYAYIREFALTKGWRVSGLKTVGLMLTFHARPK